MEITTEKLQEYLKDNLSVNIKCDHESDYGSSYTSICVELLLNGEVISSSCDSIYD